MSESRKKHGCLFYAFLCFIAFIVLIAGCLYYSYKTKIAPYVSSKPQVIQVPALQPEEAQKLMDKFNKQTQAIKEKKETTISVSQDELNYLINHHDFADFNPHFMDIKTPTEISLHQNKISTKSFLKITDNKYLNFSGEYETDLANAEESKVSLKVVNSDNNETKELLNDNLKNFLDRFDEVKITDLNVQEGHLSITISPVITPTE